MGKILYLVHARDDVLLATLLKREIEQQIPAWRVFLPSSAGEIPTDDERLSEVHQHLEEAEAFILLLTPTSVERPWIW